jgi:hypothetical protein
LQIHPKVDPNFKTVVYGTPEIVNTDQGSQFTAQEFVKAVEDRGCRLSMDGRGTWRDNVFVERLWKSVKYERVYLHAYDSVTAARQSIMQYFDWYNGSRLHSRLNKKTPDEAYAVLLPKAGQDENWGLLDVQEEFYGASQPIQAVAPPTSNPTEPILGATA